MHSVMNRTQPVCTLFQNTSLQGVIYENCRDADITMMFGVMGCEVHIVPSCLAGGRAPYC